eukprot:CAMPEP_0170281118 /NCGR_PEP_ID=MMETSP0116_2-20130129/40578_1 /TAXON_ID=400756 /ORGANISM="Durinskia baltica, Strain CSIRO CS-38" /LENGTH=251 /DNA_ID=CAMNT_0010532459 /DNA_START=42 /DNA_END=797 /DNA_ORIENTATION=-
MDTAVAEDSSRGFDDPGLGDDDPESGAGEEDFTALRRAWSNEKYAPELLPFNERAVLHVSEVVEFITSDLDEERGDEDQDLNDPSRVLRTAELERIKYVLRDYLRIRIWKLTQWPQHYLDSANISFLSVAERSFLREYWGNKRKFFETRLLSVLPPAKKGLADRIDLLDMVRKPILDKTVYVRVHEDIDLVLPSTSPDQQSTTQPSAGATGSGTRFGAGQTYLVPYAVVRPFLVEREHADANGNFTKVSLV